MLDMSNKEAVINKLNELKAKNLPRVTIEDFGKLNKSFARDIENATDEEKREISAMLEAFHIDPNGCCIFTEERPLLEWSLVHGTMFDHNTGLSWRAYHYFTIEGKEKMYDTILQYHPSNYEAISDDEE